MKPKGNGQDEGLLAEYLEDIIGTNKYVADIDARKLRRKSKISRPNYNNLKRLSPS
jgi:hypothetical protein